MTNPLYFLAFQKKEAESDDEEMEVIIKKTGFAAFQMDECDKYDHVIDSDESPIIAKAPKQTVKKGKKKQEEGEENVAEATNEGENKILFEEIVVFKRDVSKHFLKN